MMTFVAWDDLTFFSYLRASLPKPIDSTPFFVAGFKAIFIGGVALLPPLLLMHYSEQRIGGITGDVIGAVNELSELTILFACLIILS